MCLLNQYRRQVVNDVLEDSRQGLGIAVLDVVKTTVPNFCNFCHQCCVRTFSKSNGVNGYVVSSCNLLRRVDCADGPSVFIAVTHSVFESESLADRCLWLTDDGIQEPLLFSDN